MTERKGERTRTGRQHGSPGKVASTGETLLSENKVGDVVTLEKLT